MPNSSELESIVRDIRQRVTRIESRICRIGDEMGISLGEPKKGLYVLNESEDEVKVSTLVMDISLSEVLHFLNSHGIENKDALVLYNGIEVARIFFNESVGRSKLEHADRDLT